MCAHVGLLEEGQCPHGAGRLPVPAPSMWQVIEVRVNRASRGAMPCALRVEMIPGVWYVGYRVTLVPCSGIFPLPGLPGS